MTASRTELYERSFIAPSALGSSTAPPRFPLTTLNWALLPASGRKARLKMLHGFSRMVQSGRQLSGRGTPRRVPPALVALYYFMTDEVSPGYQSLNDLGLQPVLPTLTLTHPGQRTQLSLCSATQTTHIMCGLRFWLKLLWKHLRQRGHRASSLHLQNAWYKSRGTLTPAV